MPVTRLDPARRQFLERIATQLRARYPGWEFLARDDDFSVLGRRGEAQVSLALEPLYDTTTQPGAVVPQEISGFVARLAPRLSAAEQSPGRDTPLPDPGALLWCVREQRSIRAFSRFAELACRELPAGLLAFVAETLPGEALRGVSRDDAQAGGLEEADLVTHADHNTGRRLRRWREVMDAEPGQLRWLFTDDQLFASSLLVVPEFLEELCLRGGGQAALAVPDRGMVVGAVGTAAEPEAMVQVSRRLYRLATHPLSPLVLRARSGLLEVHPIEAQRAARPSFLQRLLGSPRP